MLSFATLLLVTPVTGFCGTLQSTFYEMQCCPGTAEVAENNVCWFQRAAFPFTTGDAAPYVYDGNLMKADANTVLYAYVDGTAANNANPSLSNDAMLRTAFSLDASATIEYNNGQIYDLLLQDLDEVVVSDAAKAVRAGTYLLVNPSNGLAYRTSTPVTKNFSDYLAPASWFDPVIGSSYVFYACDEHDTLFPAFVSEVGTAARPVATRRSAAELDPLSDPRLSWNNRVLKTPAGSGVTEGENVTLRDVCTKRFCNIEYHACWCPTCLNAVMNPWAMSMEAAAATAFHTFMQNTTLADSMSEMLFFTPNTISGSLDVAIASGYGAQHNITSTREVFAIGLELSSGTLDFFDGALLANERARGYCHALGLVEMEAFFGDTMRATVQGLQNGSDVTDAAFYAMRLPTVTVVDAGMYATTAFPMGSNTAHIVVDMQLNKTVVPKQAVFALGDHWLMPTARKYFFKILGQEALLDDWAAYSKTAAAPSNQYTHASDAVLSLVDYVRLS